MGAGDTSRQETCFAHLVTDCWRAVKCRPSACGLLLPSSCVSRVLFLGASVSQVDAIRCARERGFHVIAVDADPGAVGFADADESEVLDFSDVERVVELGRLSRIEAVVAVSTDRAV